MDIPTAGNSLRTRLSRTLSVMLVLIFLAQWLMLTIAIRKVSEDQMLMHLGHDRDSLVKALSLSADGRPVLDASVVEPVYDQPLSGHYYVVLSGDERAFASRSHAQQSFAVRRLAPGQREHYSAIGPGGQSVLVYARGVQLGPRELTVAVAENLDEMNKEIRELSIASFLLIPPLLVAAVFMQTWAVRRALRPLTGIRDELRGIEHGERDRIAGRLPDEIQPLVDEVNRLLAQLQRRLVQSRNATGNLAHTLKTPLTALVRLIEEQPLDPGTRQQLLAQTSHMSERIDRELKRARFAGAGQAGSLVNLRQEIPVLVALMRRVYEHKALDIRWKAPDEWLAYDRQDMLELLGNLLDNACKWARSTIILEVTRCTLEGREAACLQVSDDGPGCAPEEASRLMQRGVRLDESRPGYGIGLATVSDLVLAYHGQLGVDLDPDLGGLRVRAVLTREAVGSPGG